MSTNKQALRTAAEKATHERWAHLNGIVYAHTEETEWELFEGKAYRNDDAAFIAAANPATVLALLDELGGEAGRIKELESQRQLSFMASNRWAEKFREAEQRNAELAAIITKQEKWIKDVEVTMIAATDRAEAAEKRIAELTTADGNLIAWESTTPVYIKFITDERYQRLRAGVRKWYKPYRALTAPLASQ